MRRHRVGQRVHPDRERRARGEQRRHDREQQHVLHHVRGQAGRDRRVERRFERDEQDAERARERKRLQRCDDPARGPRRATAA